MKITAEAVELFHRAISIQTDDPGMAHCIFLLSNGYIPPGERFEKMWEAAYDDADTHRRWLRNPEYIEVRDALGAALELGPQDINPLDIEYGQEWASPDDPGIAIWKRAVDLRRRLHEAHLDWLLPSRNAG